MAIRFRMRENRFRKNKIRGNAPSIKTILA